MLENAYARTAMLLGEDGLGRLRNSFVAVAGLGGVGGHCAEALARAGIGALFLIDRDTVEETNLNRQLVATKATLGMPKAEAMRRRVEEVSDCRAAAAVAHIAAENAGALLPEGLSFIVDAVDTVTAKLALMQYAAEHAVPLISCMGAGNRLDPSAFYITDIYSTEGCPLARAVRKAARERGLPPFPVVMSRETPLSPGGRTPGSVSFVPAAAGLVLAGYVVRALAGA